MSRQCFGLVGGLGVGAAIHYYREDLALIFDQSNTPFPHLDCARVHIDRILRTMLD